MKNLAFHSLLRWKMIILAILTTSLIHFSFKGWANVLFGLGSWLIQFVCFFRGDCWVQYLREAPFCERSSSSYFLHAGKIKLRPFASRPQCLARLLTLCDAWLHKGPFTHATFDAISDAISRTKRAWPYPARIFFSWSIAWIGKKVITYYFKKPFFPISANLVVFCRRVTRLQTRAG